MTVPDLRSRLTAVPSSRGVRRGEALSNLLGIKRSVDGVSV